MLRKLVLLKKHLILYGLTFEQEGLKIATGRNNMKQKYEQIRSKKEQTIRKRNQVILFGLSLLLILSMIISLVKV